ncbi:thioredoxin family protein [Stieleria marina]|uniref:Thiol-disulfide oxidoreductase ResA n=1 Tax=Stieleria marina TaxID=1930275 RepID=A0A517NT96_9BACT|nr:Thiol-disulfide oxidoreductase ResA [Planctomycetes bacterium K23_9]
MRPLISLSTTALAFLLASSQLLAGEFNPDMNIGDAAPAWNQLPGVDGKSHSLSDLAKNKVVVVVFTCNSCPYAIDAEDRLISLHAFCEANSAALIAINVNKIPADAFPAMKDKAKAKSYKFPYLFDETQAIAKAFGARYTPECFVLDEQRKIVYMGSIDDSPDGKAVTVKHIENAIRDTLDKKQPAVQESVPIGCRIRFDRVKRTRRQPSES